MYGDGWIAEAFGTVDATPYALFIDRKNYSPQYLLRVVWTRATMEQGEFNKF